MRSLTARTGRPTLVLALVILGAGCAGPASAPGPPLPARLLRATPPTASPPVSLGADTVQLLPRGATAFPVIESLIRGARHRVDVEMYELQRAELVADLVDARRRGLAVTVIVDPTGAGTTASASRLRAAGVDVADYPVRRLMIDHVKLLVVDAEVAVVGGINWGAASSEHRDFDALIRGPAAVDLERVWDRDLLSCGRLDVLVPPPLPDPDVVVASTLPQTGIRPLVVAAIEAARTRLDLELFVLTDVGVVHALERARTRRVAVHVLLDPSERPSDASAAELRANGVEVRLYRPIRGEKLHAKAMVVDAREVLFGSANWSGGGFTRNHEIDIDLPDAPTVARSMLAAMQPDWEASADGAPDAAPDLIDGANP